MSTKKAKPLIDVDNGDILYLHNTIDETSYSLEVKESFLNLRKKSKTIVLTIIFKNNKTMVLTELLWCDHSHLSDVIISTNPDCLNNILNKIYCKKRN